MRNHRVSLRDIAALSGVTKMTVSRYLREPSSVSLGTREKIARVLEDIHYVPSRSANMMLNAKSSAIGILIPSFQNQVFADILAGMESVTGQYGFQLLISEYNYSSVSEEKQILNLMSYDVEGLVLCEKSHTSRARGFLTAANIPIVEIMDTLEPQIDIEIGFNNRVAAYEMVTTMIGRGKRVIYYFSSRDDQRDNQRYAGYQQAMAKHGLDVYRLTPNKISSFSLGALMLQQALKEKVPPDGIFCTNDDIAVGVLFECLRNNISVPDTISIAGFHGLDIGKAVTPMLASVNTPRFAIGKLSAEMLINKINSRPVTRTIDVGFDIFQGETI
ncbi:DNA-binding transcriptional regulator IdnR [Sodalis sp. RH21]|uniref:DNA-binding transcriptional regulator IdnR n=1 Tax=unclassified Sodalis (in: enterobacteria) TaxID=2636512 RepID=UPI0039B6C118